MQAKPRVVVVGAGMAGLAAAHRLHAACGHAFDLTILEGSNCVGGRIQTARLGNDLVELGATFIHGIIGNPIYQIAQRIGAFSEDPPRDFLDGKQYPLYRAQGADLLVEPRILSPVIEFYKSSMALVREKEIVGQALHGSVGAFLRQRLHAFLSELANKHTSDYHCNEAMLFIEQKEKSSKAAKMWNPRLLQESAFLSLEAIERYFNACDSLDDLDLVSLKEYKEYPGPNVTIDKGYSSVLNELEDGLPSEIVKLEKKVQKIFWNHSHPLVFAPVVLQCEDGSIVQAEHVILTMSLGVLKAGTSKSSCTKPLPPISRSVQDLRGWKGFKEGQSVELFEPSLPPWKLDAISRLGFGVVDKVFILLDPAADMRLFDNMAFLYHKELNDTPTWISRTPSLLSTREGSNVVSFWLVGEEALEMESLSDEEVLDGVAQMLSTFGLANTDEDIGLNTNNMPGQTIEARQSLRRMFKGLLRSTWATNPACQGSYSFIAVGATGADIDILAKPLLDTSGSVLASSKPSQNVCLGDDIDSKKPTEMVSGHSSPLQLLFAGEATHRSFYSTTHGAFLSGMREAERILKHYNKDFQQMS